MRPMPIYLVRHGDRLDFHDRNWVKTAKAPDDPPLADRGHQQGQEVAARLSKEVVKPCVVFSSPYYRCVSTAAYTADALDCPIKIEDGVCEILGRTYHSFPPNYRKAAELSSEFGRIDASYVPAIVPKQEEHYDFDCFQRVAPMAKIFEGAAHDRTVIVFAHGASLTGLLKAWTGKVTYPGLCTVTKMVYDSGAKKYIPEFVWSDTHLSDKKDLRPW